MKNLLALFLSKMLVFHIASFERMRNNRKTYQLEIIESILLDNNIKQMK